MSNSFVRILPGVIIDKDNPPQPWTVKLTPGQSGIQIVSLQTRPYRKPVIVQHLQSWDAIGNGFITFHLLVNGVGVFQYEAQQVSNGTPGTDTYLPKEIIVPQLATITVTADLASGATGNVNFTEQLTVFYIEDDAHLPQKVNVQKQLPAVTQWLGKPDRRAA